MTEAMPRLLGRLNLGPSCSNKPLAFVWGLLRGDAKVILHPVNLWVATSFHKKVLFESTGTRTSPRNSGLID